MDAKTRRRVRQRAGDRCEYCQLQQDQSPLAALQIEHIIPKKHGGDDTEDNLALACIDCNLAKSSNLTGIDPESGRVTPLFHPRTQTWSVRPPWATLADIVALKAHYFQRKIKR